MQKKHNGEKKWHNLQEILFSSHLNKDSLFLSVKSISEKKDGNGEFLALRNTSKGLEILMILAAIKEVSKPNFQQKIT